MGATQSRMLSTSSPAGPAISHAALKGTALLFKLCRYRKDIPDPRQFVFAIAYVLNDYPEDVIRRVTDPITGLPGRLKYPLEIADVKRACDMANIPHLLEAEERQRQQAERAAAEAAASADVDARLRIVRLIREMGYDGEAAFQFMESWSPTNVRWFLDRYLAGKTIEVGLGELIEDWHKAGSPPARVKEA
jgi:hypothetical protein